MWVLPDEARIEPGYEQLDITAELERGGLVPVASGRPEHESAIRIKQKDAALFAARLAPGESVTLPAAPWVHLYVARGAVVLEGAGRLDTGDAVRLTAADGQRVTALDVPAEVLVWEMHAALGALRSTEPSTKAVVGRVRRRPCLGRGRRRGRRRAGSARTPGAGGRRRPRRGGRASPASAA